MEYGEQFTFRCKSGRLSRLFSWSRWTPGSWSAPASSPVRSATPRQS